MDLQNFQKIMSEEKWEKSESIKTELTWENTHTGHKECAS